MFLDQPLAWTTGNGSVVLAAGVLLALLAALGAFIVHRTSGAVLTAGIGALVCTTYSADTSWNFARDHLGMTQTTERLVMFAAGEIALLACAVMARANKRATATNDSAGTPGVPGVLVWCITGIQIIPAYSESGFWGGSVRAVIGPVMAGLLWHLAMGLEIRVARPEALSSGLPAQIGHELRERLLSHLGLATRNRTAEEITRDRAHARAVRLGARRHLGPWGRARLAAAVTRSRATVDGTRRHDLLQDLAGRRSADQLRTMDVVSPWVASPATEPHPATPLGVTGAELRRMHPMDAIQAVRDAHPDATVPELASLCTEYGVTASEGMVRIALHPKAAQPDAHPQPPMLAVQPRPALAPAPEVQPEPSDFDTAAASALAVAQPTTPQPDTAAAAGGALVLDLAPMLPLQPEVLEGNPPLPPTAQPQPPQVTPAATAPRPARRPLGGKPPTRPKVAQLRTPDSDAEVLERALALNARVLAETNSPVSMRQLQRELGIGQRRAQRIHAQLPTAVTAAQPPAKEA